MNKNAILISKDQQWSSKSKAVLEKNGFVVADKNFDSLDSLHFYLDEFRDKSRSMDDVFFLIDIDDFSLFQWQRVSNFFQDIFWIPVSKADDYEKLKIVENASRGSFLYKDLPDAGFLSFIENSITRTDVRFPSLRIENRIHGIDISEDKMCRLFDQIPVLIAFLDSDRNIIRSNRMLSEKKHHQENAIFGGRIGKALDCIHYLNNPNGCEETEYCKHCELRKLLYSSFSDNTEFFRKEVSLTIEKDQKRFREYYYLTTRIIDVHPEYHVIIFLEDITEQKEIEMRYRESEDRFRKLSNLTFEGIFIHQSGIINDLNARAEELTGYSREELIGENAIAKLIMPEFHVKIRDNIQKSAAKPYEVQAKKKDGSLVWVEIEARDVQYKSEMFRVAAIRDVTDRRKARLQLLSSRQNLNSIIENMGEALIVAQNGYIVFGNKQMENIIGYTMSEIRSRPFIDFIYPEDREFVYERYSRRIAGQKIINRYDFRLVSKNNGIRWIRISASIFQWNSQVATLNMLTDITDQKKIEEDLIRARDEADKANKAKSDFLASMSHEIRTPMNAIIGMTDLAIMTPHDDEKREYLDIVKSSASHLLSIINDILDISKIESGKMELEIKNYDLPEVVHTCYRIFEKEIEKDGIHFKLELDKNLPEMVSGDPTRLRQVIVNLLSNARKFTEEGEITLSAKKVIQPNEADNNNSKNMIEISVADTGIGISRKIQHIIFKEFNQADVSISRKYGGTGLGLSISKKIITMMNGQIDLQSTPGEGSRFYFVIPETEPIEEKRNNKTRKKIPRIVRSKKLHVLIAEDNEVNSLLASKILTNAGHWVQIAKNGIETIDLLRQSEKENEMFDLILMDIEMPKMDGIEATRRIRKGEAGKAVSTIPIIAMSAHAVTSVQADAMQAGMNGYITKPVDITKLQISINEIMDQ